jgi:hypothetical protein
MEDSRITNPDGWVLGRCPLERGKANNIEGRSFVAVPKADVV